ncbi:MAG: hypothetical protein LLF94_00735 [Chlamydiales bacterium]|nr:hypothetical protein [Chlamydiales bacterium]
MTDDIYEASEYEITGYPMLVKTKKKKYTGIKESIIACGILGALTATCSLIWLV